MGVWACLLAVPVALSLGSLGAASRPPIGPVQSAFPKLSGARAVALWRDLDRGRRRVYATRDITLAPRYFTDGPILATAAREVGGLRRDHVRSKTRFRTLEVDVVGSGGAFFAVSQLERIVPRFEARGRDVTTSEPFVHRVVWIIRLERGRWLLHRGTVVGEREAR